MGGIGGHGGRLFFNVVVRLDDFFCDGDKADFVDGAFYVTAGVAEVVPGFLAFDVF